MKRLDQEERYQIYAMKRAGFSQKAIADELMRSPSTICREFKRNTGERGYRPKQAHEKAIAREANKPKSRKLSSSLLFKINQKLEDDWSPEQIFGYYQNQGEKMLSHESIYQYIWRDKAEGGLLYKHLRRACKSKKVYGKRDLRGHIKNRVSIDERPPEVNEKKEFGHWEIDLMVVSKRSSFQCSNQLKNASKQLQLIMGKNLQDTIMSRLNNRPRKTLDYKLPKILFKLERSKIALVA